MTFDPASLTADRARLYRLLGDLPVAGDPVTARLVGEDRGDSFSIERLTLNLNGFEPVPAYFIAPAKIPGPYPVILYNHYHGNKYALGKDEVLTDKPAAGLPSWAADLIARGYAVLCIDHWGFGARATRSEADIFKSMLWQGRVMWGMMVYDSIRALDYLSGRDDIDPARIGTLGMSMGATMAWWLAALDERVKVCVDLCCLTDFHTYLAGGDLSGHGIYYFVPGLLKEFSTSQINALIAPRPHLSVNGVEDPLTPPAGLDVIDAEVSAAYRAAGVPDRWSLRRFPVGHTETADMRSEILAFLAVYL